MLLEERAHVVGRVVPRDVLRDEPRPRLHFLLRHRLRRRGRGGTSGRAGSESEGGAVTAGAGSEGDVARGEAQAKRGLALAGGGRGEEAGEGERHGESSRRWGRRRYPCPWRGLAGFYPPRQNIPARRQADAENVRGQRPGQVPARVAERFGDTDTNTADWEALCVCVFW